MSSKKNTFIWKVKLIQRFPDVYCKHIMKRAPTAARFTTALSFPDVYCKHIMKSIKNKKSERGFIRCSDGIYYKVEADFYTNWPIVKNRETSFVVPHIRTSLPSCFKYPVKNPLKNLCEEVNLDVYKDSDEYFLLFIDKENMEKKILSPLSIASINPLLVDSDEKKYSFFEVDSKIESDLIAKGDMKRVKPVVFGHIPNVKHQITHAVTIKNKKLFRVATALNFNGQSSNIDGVAIDSKNYPSYAEAWTGQDVILAYILSNSSRFSNKEFQKEALNFFKEITSHSNRRIWNKYPVMRICENEQQPFSLFALLVLYAYAGIDIVKFNKQEVKQTFDTNKEPLSLFDKKNKKLEDLLEKYNSVQGFLLECIKLFKPDINSPVYNQNYLGDNEASLEQHGDTSLLSFMSNLFPYAVTDLLIIYENEVDFTSKNNFNRVFSHTDFLSKDDFSPVGRFDCFCPVRDLSSLHKAVAVLKQIKNYLFDKKQAEKPQDFNKNCSSVITSILDSLIFEDSHNFSHCGPVEYSELEARGFGVRFRKSIIEWADYIRRPAKEEDHPALKDFSLKKDFTDLCFIGHQHDISRVSALDALFMCDSRFLDLNSLFNKTFDLLSDLAVYNDQTQKNVNNIDRIAKSDILRPFIQSLDIPERLLLKTKQASIKEVIKNTYLDSDTLNSTLEII